MKKEDIKSRVFHPAQKCLNFLQNSQPVNSASHRLNSKLLVSRNFVSSLKVVKNNFLVFVIILLVASVPFVVADVISVNSGGGDEVVITSNQELEGFFFKSNQEPIDPTVTLFSADGTNESDSDLICNFYVEDADSSTLTGEINWFESDVSELEYNLTSLSNATYYNTTLLSGNLTLGDVWKCSVKLYDAYDSSNEVTSNEVEIIDITDPIVYIVSPQPPEVQNYSTLEVDFNVSVVENENVSTCLYSLNGEANVSMTEVNDSYFWSEPVLGPGPQNVSYYCNDTSGNWGYNFTEFNILNEAAISVLISDDLLEGVRWNLVSLPVDDQGAIGNNGTGITLYYLNISATNTLVDVYMKADGDLQTVDLDTLGLGNETYKIGLNDPIVNVTEVKNMTTNYELIGSSLDDGDVVYLKFFIDAPASQPAGEYLNSLDIKAVREGQSV